MVLIKNTINAEDKNRKTPKEIVSRRKVNVERKFLKI